MKRILMYILYSILVLLLLILLMVIGVKFAQLNKEITDVKLQLKTINNRRPSLCTSGPCREGWGSFQGSCYLLSTTTATWQRAEDQCRSHGGHLLVLNNVEELR
ncbi:hypothetical protein AMECASPLE_038359 [Ameca splendens]|uniref:C-type lectin domain-containing protein n=1 Tax=Ameca splendens TaxID=208324 RepID=A0ABV0YWI4_9TELE